MTRQELLYLVNVLLDEHSTREEKLRAAAQLQEFICILVPEES